MTSLGRFGGTRYAYRRPYVVRRYRDDNPPPPFPFLFGR